MIKTVTTTTGVNTVTFPEFFKYFWIKNIGDTTVYASAFANVSAGVDNTSTIKSGDTVCVENIDNDNVYISGEGSVEIHAQNYADCPFKAGGKGGESPDLSAYAKTADIQNENLLINPDFKINQRGVSGTFSEAGKYFVDRWRLVSGAVTVNADGTLTLNGTMSQILENAVGDNVTASVSAGTAVYDNSTKTFSITANGEIISWAKLEYGSNATQFFPPDTATELMKCKRFYRTLNRGTLAYSSNSESVVFVETFDMPMRVNPDVKILSTVELTYCNGWIDEPNVSDMSIVSYNITNMGVCYLQVGGFNMTVNGTAFAENFSFRAATDNFIGLDAEIY